MILVTGGTGLVGSHLLYELASRNKAIRAIRRKGSSLKYIEKTFAYYSNQPDILLKKIEWVEGDMMDYFSLIDAMQGVDFVYHCAATISFNPKDAEMMLRQNIEGTANVVNACLERGIKKACFVSSVAALGQTNTQEPISEGSFWKASPKNSVYSVSKYTAEQEIWRGIEEGLNAVIVNPGIIIGPGNWSSGSSNMFSTGYKGLKYFSRGISGFVDVRDVAKIMTLLMESESSGDRFILCSENVEYKTFFDYMHDAFSKPRPYIFANVVLSELVWRFEVLRSLLTGGSPLLTKETVRSAHQINYFSNKKVRTFLNFSFIPVKQSVEDTCKHFVKDLKS